MSRRSIQWLLAELPELVRSGVITQDSASSLVRHYEDRDQPPATAVTLVVFGVLGALLIGGGIILLLAHNWQEIPRLGRSALVLGMLLSAQGLAAWVLVSRRSSSVAWSEAGGMLLVIAVGASVSLISQTYHTLGDLGGFLRICLLLSLPVMYLLRSCLAAATYWIGATVWLGAAFGAPQASGRFAAFLLLTGLTVPFLVQAAIRDEGRRRQALFWVVAFCVVATPIILLGWRSRVPDIIIASGLLAGTCAWPLTSRQPIRRSPASPFLLLGGLGVFISLVFFFSYRGVWAHLLGTTEPLTITDQMWTWGTTAAILASAAFLVILFLRNRRWPEACVAMFPMVVGAAPYAGKFIAGDEQTAMLVINVYGLLLGLLLFRGGLRSDRLDVANAGLLLVLALLIARFFDADWTFLSRGIGFILLGCAFLGANLWLIAHRRRVAT